GARPVRPGTRARGAVPGGRAPRGGQRRAPGRPDPEQRRLGVRVVGRAAPGRCPPDDREPGLGAARPSRTGHRDSRCRIVHARCLRLCPSRTAGLDGRRIPGRERAPTPGHVTYAGPMRALIPEPTSVVPGEGEFVLHAGTGVQASPAIADLVRELLGPATGYAFPPGPDIVFTEDERGDEGYRLLVTADRIE